MLGSRFSAGLILKPDEQALPEQKGGCSPLSGSLLVFFKGCEIMKSVDQCIQEATQKATEQKELNNKFGKLPAVVSSPNPYPYVAIVDGDKMIFINKKRVDQFIKELAMLSGV